MFTKFTNTTIILVFFSRRRIRDKYESEIKELEHSERHTQDKCKTLKTRVEELENDTIRLRSNQKMKEQELLDNQKLTTRLQEERGKVTDIIRQEFADRFVLIHFLFIRFIVHKLKSHRYL